MKYCLEGNNHKHGDSAKLWGYIAQNLLQSESVLVEILRINGSIIALLSIYNYC
jgi:hypothetical protein